MPVVISSRGVESNSTNSCKASSFEKPELFGGEILSISAAEVHEYALASANITNLNFCVVNVTYTHPGYNDTILVTVWLPLTGWNSRFQGAGGGGYSTATYDTALAPAVSQGYAVATTNGGHVANSFDTSTWALNSPGNVNYDLLIDFSSKSLDDLPIIGKAITANFYGTPPKYSYWNGCSTGGRQGFMSAQRYPKNYNGIMANAPALYWTRFIPAEFYGNVAMHEEGQYPPECEFAAFTAAAVKACDGLDGVIDGVIAAPGLCQFDPLSLVGQSYNCSGAIKTFSIQAATIVQKIWQGPETADGSFLWYGFHKDANLSTNDNTTQYANGTYGPFPDPLGANWFTYFVVKNPSFDPTKITYDEFAALLEQGQTEYGSIIDTDNPDLSEFKAVGGKLLTWHGVADQYIPTNGSIQYYKSALALDSQLGDYFRLFLAPGVGHCQGGVGFVPDDPLGALVEWVENDIAPATLSGTSLTSGRKQPLCPYPLVAKWDGIHDSALASSYECSASF